ncbi:hypothetical protein ACFPM1_15140 [Halorubrum rubrum]|uniref:RCK C-terminal domain-containing protein n=1 Tax=Halorubrum rubrum TaxID=1126240 RepID=A0ABD5R509_9EURY|nr:hypothetical protein [Halorubrum rubrum]
MDRIDFLGFVLLPRDSSRLGRYSTQQKNPLRNVVVADHDRVIAVRPEFDVALVRTLEPHEVGLDAQPDLGVIVDDVRGKPHRDDSHQAEKSEDVRTDESPRDGNRSDDVLVVVGSEDAYGALEELITAGGP